MDTKPNEKLTEEKKTKKETQPLFPKVIETKEIKKKSDIARRLTLARLALENGVNQEEVKKFYAESAQDIESVVKKYFTQEK